MSIKPINRWTEQLEDNRYKVYTNLNPRYYQDSTGSLNSIDLTYSSSKSNSNIGNFVLFDKNVNSVGIRTDNNTTKYVGVRPDNTQTIGSQQYEWSIENININKNNVTVDIGSFDYEPADFISTLGNVKIQSNKQTFRQMVQYTGSINDFKITYKLHLEGLQIFNNKYTENTTVRNAISCSLIDCGNISGNQYLSQTNLQTHVDSILSTYITDDTLIINPNFNPNPYYNRTEMSSSEFTVNTSSFSIITRDSSLFWGGDNNTNDYMSSIYVKDNMLLRFKNKFLANNVKDYILELLNAEIDGNYIRIKNGKKVGSYVYLTDQNTSYITLALQDITHISSSYRYKDFDDFSHITMSYSDIISGIPNHFISSSNEVTASTSHYKPIDYNFYIKDRNNNIKYVITPPLLLDSNYNSVSDEIITEHTLKDNGDGTYEYIKYPNKTLLYTGSAPSNTNYIDASTIYVGFDGYAYAQKQGLVPDPFTIARNAGYDSSSLLPFASITGNSELYVGVRTDFIPGAKDYQLSHRIHRSFLQFDVGSINGVVTDARLNLYGNDDFATAMEYGGSTWEHNMGDAIRVLSASYSPSGNISGSAYNGAIDLDNLIDYASGSQSVVTGSYNEISLLPAAMSDIQDHDTLQLCLMEFYSDWTNNPNFAGLNTDWADGMDFVAIESGSGTGSADPYLVVTADAKFEHGRINLKQGRFVLSKGRINL